MNDDVNNSTPETESRCWMPYDPESVVGEIGWLHMPDGLMGPEWALICTVEPGGIDAPLLVRFVERDMMPDDEEMEFTDRYIGLPYLTASEPTIEPGKSDGVEVRITLPGGGSVTHALPPSYDASELSRLIAGLIREMCDE